MDSNEKLLSLTPILEEWKAYMGPTQMVGAFL